MWSDGDSRSPQVGLSNGTGTWKVVWRLHTKLNSVLACDPAVTRLSTHPPDLRTKVRSRLRAPCLSIVVSFITDKSQDVLRSANGWTNSRTPRKQSTRRGQWINLKRLSLSGRSQLEKATPHHLQDVLENTDDGKQVSGYDRFSGRAA